MSDFYSILGLDLDKSSELGATRYSVLTNSPWTPTATTNVAYTAANRLLIISDIETATEIETQLPEKILTYIAVPSDKSGASRKANAFNCRDLHVTGYLGRFEVHVDSDTPDTDSDHNNLAKIFNLESGLFDQVLDCSNNALIGAAIKPPGYYHAPHEEFRDDIVQNIPEMIGEFEKPKYFDYNPEICAHGRSGIPGCTRCLDACPTDAIISLGETIEVNPHLCQGGGSCTASCPTGAISYLYPKPEEQIEFLRVLIKSMREQSSECGLTLLVFDEEHGRNAIEAVAPQLGGHVLPFLVEEIGSVGLDLMSSALAWGANQLVIHVAQDISDQVRTAIDSNIEIIQSVLDQTRCRSHSISIVSDVSEIPAMVAPQYVENTATFAAVGNKRNNIRAALNYFQEISENQPELVTLPPGSLFGTVNLNNDACTLCMGCVSQCPGNALQAGGEEPALRFIEANCVQCGICTRTCPETAMELESRLHFDHDTVSRTRTLKEEPPFRCITCGKPFATKAMISKMTEKLKGHWMFDKPDALNRLQMCEDCRVKDMFDKEDHIQ